MNKHIERAVAIQRRPKIGFLILEILFVIVLPFMLAMFVRDFMMDVFFYPVIDQFKQAWFLSFRSMLFHLTSFGFVLGYLFFMVKFYERRPISSLGFTSNHKLKRGLVGALTAILMMSSIVLLMLVFDQGTVKTDHLLASGIRSLPYLFIILLGWLVQGSTEEIVFQGWLLPKVGKTFGVMIGVLVVAVFFAFAHGLNPNMSIIAILNLVMYGLFAALYVLYERGLIGVMMFHAFWNFFQGSVFGLAVSGGGLAAISMTSIRIEEETVLNGGEFGAEGGLFASFVLVVGILAYYIYIKKGLSKLLRSF